MKKFKRLLPIIVTGLLLVSSMIFSSAETIYDKYDYYWDMESFVNGNSDSLGFTMNDIKFDTADGAYYAYIIENGEATVFNVRTNFVDSQKSVFTFATHLGGLPVTAIVSDELGVSVFLYLQYPGDVTPDNPVDYTEIDPGLKNVSKIVIPEGYKKIYGQSFKLVAYIDISLPESLTYIEYDAFEEDVNFVDTFVPGVNEITPATDTPYYEYGNRDYTLNVTGSPSKIQVVRYNGGTTTIDRRRAQVTSNGETETWVVNMRVEAGTHNIRAKYGNKWDERLTPFTVTYDTPPTPKAYSFDLCYKNGLGTFEVVTDPQIIKVQFLLDNGCTLTYSQGNSYVAEDGLRHWVITRKIPANTNYTLKTKLGYTWTTTDLTVNS